MMKAEHFFFCSLIYLKIWEIWSLDLWAVPGIGRVLRKHWLSEMNDILIYSQKAFFFFLLDEHIEIKERLSLIYVQKFILSNYVEGE